MKRILLVTPELQYTGACQSFRRICKVLIKHHYAIDVWSYRDGVFKDEFSRLGVPVRIIDPNTVTEEFIAKEITKYHLVIANTVVTYRIADFAQHYIPVVWYIREAENLPDFFWEKGRESALRRAKKVYCVSEYAQSFIAQNYNKNVYVVHNFVDDVYEDYRNTFPKNKKIKFLALGTIEKRKSYHILVDAFLSLPQEVRKKCELHFAGRKWDGAKDFYPQILKCAEDNDDIFYHGELRDRDKIHRLIADCDVVVVPSLDESCSLVALEGAMLSKPLILSKNIGAKYLLTPENGWLVKTGDVEALRNAYCAAVENRDKLSAMGERARRKYLETSTEEIYEKNILKMVSDNICEDPYFYYIQDKTFDLFTFDVFDTLITRSVANPRDIFQEMQNHLSAESSRSRLPESLIINFPQIRRDVEQFLYRRVCHGEKMDINIDEIYAIITNDYSLSEDQNEYLKQLEINAEKDTILPLERGISIVKQLVKNGKRVALISDMYFDAATIRVLLTSVDAVFSDIPIYVSSEYARKKNSGALYEVVKKIEDVQYNAWVHAGDDWNGDYVQPKKFGISAVYLPPAPFLPHEKNAIEEGLNSREAYYTVGLSRYLRSQIYSDKYQYGISFGGPFFFPYVSWVIDRSKALDISDLYFVARDGYILKAVADAILSKQGGNLKTHYIYGSRIAWRTPYETNNEYQLTLLRKYIGQEINTTLRFAFVEFAGTGVTQDTLYMSLPENMKPNWVCSFFMYQTRDPRAMASKQYSMIRARGKFYTCTELLCRAPHGQAERYTEEGNIIRPVLDNNEGRAIEQYYYQEYIDGAASFAAAYQDVCMHYHLNPCALTVQQCYYEYMTGDKIDVNLVTFLANIPFQLDGLVKTLRQYAPPLLADEYTEICEDGESAYKGHNLKWSLMITASEVKKTNAQMHVAGKEKALQDEIDSLKHSISFQLGRAITWGPRKIRGGIRCYRDNGALYTLIRIKEKVKKLR